ncbi:hypothetical protein IQ257_12480 [Coleofasciculus sp. LEGE 07092]|nr:hypothetical protein [Coleofasciculus sp. LEGE 07081]MBE9149296.1 hypothetical protein [Coleofasciculus sp. LEGE 07092]
MDTAQQQIVGLSHKVDSLYQIIDQLSHQVSECVLAIRQIPPSGSNPSSLGVNERPYTYHSPSLLDSVMEHKDILIDSNSESINSHQNSDNVLSADVQVQRLTAQLTAAYNRIAALEEQLLVRRIHS